MYSANSGYSVCSDVDKGGRSSTILLPKWLYIKDRNDRYLTVIGDPDDILSTTLTFRTGESDINCVFEAIETDTTYRFRGNNGNTIMRWNFNPGWYSCHALSSASFKVVTSSGNRAYFKDTYFPARFISDELKDTGFHIGAPFAHDYINESSNFEIVHAAITNEITSVNYDIPGGTVREAAPLTALSASVRNDSDGDLEQTLSYAYAKWKVGTWNNIAGIEIGAKATFKAGVPFVASAEFEISVSASCSHEWGGEVGKRQTITSSTTVTVPPKKKARASVIVRNAQIDVGFTYTQKILWSNGQSETEEKRGIYENVDSWHVDVVLDNLEDV